MIIIVLLGVGFLAGIQASAPDIVASLGKYMNGQKLMGFQIVSTMGLTDGDVQAIKALKGAGTVTPSYSLDILAEGDAIRVQALEDSVNLLEMVDGRMPENRTECVADSRYYKPGDKIEFTGDTEDKLINAVFTVVGTAKSSLYMSNDYGNTTVGSGKLHSFIFVDKANFTLDAYTQIYVTVSGTEDAVAFSEDYEKAADGFNDELVGIKSARESARYQEIFSEADDVLRENEDKLNKEKADAEEKLADAKLQLDGNASKLSDARQQLDKNEADLRQQADAQSAEFASAKAQIADGWDQIDSALQANGIMREEVPGQLSSLDTALNSMKEQLAALPVDSPEFTQLDAQVKQYSASYDQMLQLKSSIQSLTEQEAQLNAGIVTFNAKISEAEAQITEGKAEIEENQRKLDEGYDEYNKNLDDFNTEIGDAQAKLQDAKEELSDIKKPQWTVLDRTDVISGYNDLKSAMGTITLLAAILPIFFMLIVALMTSNTMTRMIAEERGELGTLASLGFSNGSIVSTYLFYVLSATVLGTVGGFYLGCMVIPKIVYLCFPFALPPLILSYDIVTLLLILLGASALMIAVTVISCSRELKEKPAELMRPVPPKNGQTILLERIGLIWRRLSFTWKVTMRNIFRYKQRVFMTIAGIAGCTALLLTGFGIKDSSDGIAEKQYGGIFTYDSMMVLKDETGQIDGDLKALLSESDVQNPTLIKQEPLTCEPDGRALNAYLIVPENADMFTRYFKLTRAQTETAIAMDESGVIISQKISQVYQIGQGDTLTVKDADGQMHSMYVSDVAENYLQSYIYMSRELYGKTFGESASYNMVVSELTGDKDVLAETVIGSGLVVNVNFTEDILQQVIEQNNSLNSVVILIICIASMLAVIVLYNLTSINISERKREIATLKVLGFNDGETNEYIYREALLLTLLSIGVGFILGVGFHRYVISIIERDEIVYFRSVQGWSFLWTFLITLGFSLIMQAVTYFNLKKINMIESLKSVE